MIFGWGRVNEGSDFYRILYYVFAFVLNKSFCIIQRLAGSFFLSINIKYAFNFNTYYKAYSYSFSIANIFL